MINKLLTLGMLELLGIIFLVFAAVLICKHQLRLLSANEDLLSRQQKRLSAMALMVPLVLVVLLLAPSVWAPGLEMKLAVGNMLLEEGGSIPSQDALSWSLPEGMKQSAMGQLGDVGFSVLQKTHEDGAKLFLLLLIVLGLAGTVFLSTVLFRSVHASLLVMTFYALFGLSAPFLHEQYWVFALLPMFLGWGFRLEGLDWLKLVLLSVIWLLLAADSWLPLMILAVLAFSLFLDKKNKVALLCLFSFLLVLTVKAAVLFSSSHTGFEAFFFPLGSALFGSFLPRQVFGLLPADFHQNRPFLFGVVLLFFVLVFSRKTFSWSFTWLALFSLFLALVCVRYQVFFAVMFAAAAAYLLEQFLGERARSQEHGLSFVGLAAVFLCLLFSLHSSPYAENKLLGQGLLRDLKAFRSEVNTERSSGESFRLFHHHLLAGELVADDFLVFVDSRAHLYAKAPSRVDESVSLLDDYMAVIKPRDKWQDVLEKWHFDAALVPSNSTPLSVLLERKAWKIITEEKGYTLLQPPFEQ